jgi:aminopeptidase N
LKSLIIPSEYSLRLDVKLLNYYYTGNISIKVTATEQTNVIILDSLNQVDYASVENSTFVFQLNYTRTRHQLMINLREPLYPQEEAIIYITFNGQINRNDTIGFYSSTALNELIAITQFESHGAHSVFPCFDDPALKGSFEIEISVEEPYYVISNMDVDIIKQLGNRRLFRFLKTPKLSTYLAAW